VHLRRILLPLTLVTCLALSACGGGDDDKSDDRSDDATAGASATAGTSGPATVPLPADACDLLSSDQVSDVVGAPVNKGTPTSGPATSGGSFSQCTYTSADPDNPADTAIIALYPNTDAADSARGETAQEIKGLGDSAFSASFGSVWVYVDDISLFAQWYAFDGTDQENLPKSKALAKAALDGLG